MLRSNSKMISAFNVFKIERPGETKLNFIPISPSKISYNDLVFPTITTYSLSLSLSMSKTHTRTHAHTHTQSTHTNKNCLFFIVIIIHSNKTEHYIKNAKTALNRKSFQTQGKKIVWQKMFFFLKKPIYSTSSKFVFGSLYFYFQIFRELVANNVYRGFRQV